MKKLIEKFKELPKWGKIVVASLTALVLLFVISMIIGFAMTLSKLTTKKTESPTNKPLSSNQTTQTKSETPNPELKYEIVYTLSNIRYDNGVAYYILIDPIDLSNDNFKNQIKTLIKKIVSEKGKKISIDICDNKEALEIDYQRYGTMTLTPNQSQLDLLGVHLIATFSGELKTMTYLNTLDFFPAISKDNSIVGKYVETLEFNP